MMRTNKIPVTKGDYIASFNAMLNEYRKGSDPWRGHGRSILGYTHWYQTRANVTQTEAVELATKLLAVMCNV